MIPFIGRLACRSVLLCLALIPTSTSSLNAQERVGRVERQQVLLNDVVMQPLAMTRIPELADVLQAKISVDGEERQLVILAEAFRTEKREAQVTTIRQQEQTRMVPGADGQLVEQTFTVNIPVTEIREVDTKVPAGRKPITVPLQICHFFDLNGQELSEADATERLQSLKPVFLLDGSEGELPEIPTIIKQVLKEDCLVIVTLQVIREPRPMMNRMLQLQPARALPAIQAIPAVPVLPPAQ